MHNACWWCFSGVILTCDIRWVRITLRLFCAGCKVQQLDAFALSFGSDTDLCVFWPLRHHSIEDVTFPRSFVTADCVVERLTHTVWHGLLCQMYFEDFSIVLLLSALRRIIACGDAWTSYQTSNLGLLYSVLGIRFYFSLYWVQSQVILQCGDHLVRDSCELCPSYCQVIETRYI